MMKHAACLGFAAILASAWSVPATAAPTPYQHQGSINTANCQLPHCVISFPAVPANQRLVLESISAQVLMTTRAIVLEGGSASYFVAKPYENAGNVSAPITLYYEAGQTPTARMFVPSPTDNNSLIVTLVGRLESVP